MSWAAACTLALVCLAPAVSARGASLPQTSVQDLEANPRFFFTNTSQYSVSVESLVGGAAALLSVLLLLAAATSLLALFGGGEETGYSGLSGYSGGSSHGDSYSGYSARSLDTENLWSSLQTIDWIALAEELYNTEDLISRQCQQQLVCELKRSAPAWGQTARAASGAIDYISYIKLLRLPEGVQQLLEGYDEAAGVGRGGVVPCDQKYYCSVSVRALLEKFGSASS